MAFSVGWMLLEGAVIACEKATGLAPGHADAAFYAGKKAAGIYYARNVLPNVVSNARVIAAGDTSPLDIPDGGFAGL